MAHQIERRLPKSRYYAQDRTPSNRIERKGPLWPEYVQFLVWIFFEVFPKLIWISVVRGAGVGVYLQRTLKIPNYIKTTFGLTTPSELTPAWPSLLLVWDEKTCAAQLVSSLSVLHLPTPLSTQGHRRTSDMSWHDYLAHIGLQTLVGKWLCGGKSMGYTRGLKSTWELKVSTYCVVHSGC